VYDRVFETQELTFEPSGGLINASLVMQDRETDTYWSIMTDAAVAGSMKGTKLKKMDVAQKTTWKQWRTRYPQTRVLSVKGAEDAPFGYDRYFNSDQGFRGITSNDERLPDKEAVFAFVLDDQKYAVPLRLLQGGKSYNIGAANIFLYRPAGSAIFQSTVAFMSLKNPFILKDGVWQVANTDCTFDLESGKFNGVDKNDLRVMTGFDTFWYIWSLTNPGSKILGE
jgi:hypothetical protein